MKSLSAKTTELTALISKITEIAAAVAAAAALYYGNVTV